MNKLIKNIAVSVAVFLLKRHIENTVRSARFDLARRLLIGTEEIRVLFVYFFVTMVASSLIGFGIAMFLLGFFSLVIMHLANLPAEAFKLFFWFPLGLCVGGLFCFVPALILVRTKFLSEKAWMNALKRSKIFGDFIVDVLAEAQTRLGK